MKYTCTVEIDLPIDSVVDLWNDENHFKEWQDGFVKTEPVNGEPGAIGSQSRIYLQQGKRKMELLETIRVNNLPDEKTALYEHIHMTNTQTTRFRSLSGNKTEYISEVEYLKFNGLAPKIMARFFPGMFKKQSQKWMDQFKVFAEKQVPANAH